MDLKSVIENGSEAIAAQVGKLAEAVPTSSDDNGKQGIGSSVASFVKAAAAKVEESVDEAKVDAAKDRAVAASEAARSAADKAADAARAAADKATAAASVASEKAKEVAAVASERAKDVAAVASEKAAAASEKAQDAVASAQADLDAAGSDPSRRGRLVAAGVVAGVTAAGILAWQRRRAAALAKESAWSTSDTDSGDAVVTPISTAAGSAHAAADEPAIAEVDHPDDAAMAVPGFEADIDSQGEKFADELLTEMEIDESGVSQAEDQLPDHTDPELAAEIDAEADHFAQDFVDHVEVSDEELPQDRPNA